MVYNVITTPQFENDVKYYKKTKKYLKIDDDLDDVIKNLEKGILLGDEIKDLRLLREKNVYKVRVINSSIKMGKSNGFRLIYYVVNNDYEIYLLTVYSKKDRENISHKDIAKIIANYCE